MWICNSVMITDVKHVFLCLFAICISSLGKLSIKTVGHFKNEVVFFLFAIQLYEFFIYFRY